MHVVKGQEFCGLGFPKIDCLACLDFDFVRAEGYVFAHVADEGLIDGCAGSLLRYRKRIGADHIAVITDVKKKHR